MGVLFQKKVELKMSLTKYLALIPTQTQLPLHLVKTAGFIMFCYYRLQSLGGRHYIIKFYKFSGFFVQI